MDQILSDSIKYGVRMAHTEGGWITPLLDAIKEVDFETAKWKPAEGVSSIWEIVAHTIPYTRSRYCDFTGEPNNKEEDWPIIDASSPASWDATKQNAIAVIERLQSVVDGLTTEEMASPAPGKKTPRWERLMDIIVHDAYHAGQIIKLTQAHSALMQPV